MHRGDTRGSNTHLTFKNGFNITLAVQNANNAEGIFIYPITNPDGFESRNRPGAKSLKLQIDGTIALTDQGVLLQRLNSLPYSGSEANGYVGKIPGNKVIAKLAHHIVASGLPKCNLHERWPNLRSASKAFVCAFTEPQNSSSVSSFDARPSASKASSSSRVPASPGRGRFSRAARPASTTSSPDSWAPRLRTS